MDAPAAASRPRQGTGARLAGNLVAAALGLALALGAAELAARRLASLPPKPYPAARYADFGLVRNSRSFRDYEYPLDKPPGVFRVAVVGDSFTEGQGEDFEDLWPKRLERFLNDYRSGEGRRYEVLNFAVSGSSTPRQLAIVRNQALAFRPDLVVVGYCLNDPEDEDAHRTLEISPRHIFKDYGARGPAGRWLTRHSALYRLVAGRLRNARISAWTLGYYRDIYRDDYPGWRKTREALAGFAELREQAKVPVAVMMFPLFSWDLDDGYPLAWAHEAVGKATESAGLPLLDLLPVYRGQDHVALEAIPGRDPHPSDVAHRLAAEALLPWLEERGLLGPAPPAGPPRRVAAPY